MASWGRGEMLPPKPLAHPCRRLFFLFILQERSLLPKRPRRAELQRCHRNGLQKGISCSTKISNDLRLAVACSPPGCWGKSFILGEFGDRSQLC